MTIRAGVHITKRWAKNLEEMLKEWINLNATLSRAWQSEKEAPWWYNERASIGVLAGAAWKCGGYAFEEYSDAKKSKGQRYHGRVDIEFSIGRHFYKAEAKQCWPASTTLSTDQRTKLISDAIDLALADAQGCADGATKLAIVFGSPKMKRRLEQDEKEMEKRLSWLIQMGKSIKCSAFAWVFPKLRSYPHWKRNDSIYPGAMIWIERV